MVLFFHHFSLPTLPFQPSSFLLGLGQEVERLKKGTNDLYITGAVCAFPPLTMMIMADF